MARRQVREEEGELSDEDVPVDGAGGVARGGGAVGKGEDDFDDSDDSDGDDLHEAIEEAEEGRSVKKLKRENVRNEADRRTRIKVAACARTTIWKRCKFFSSPKIQQKMMERVADELGPEDGKLRELFIRQYSAEVLVALNRKRGNVEQAMSKVIRGEFGYYVFFFPSSVSCFR